MRIGVVRNKLFGYNTAADRLAEAAVADMKKQGAVVVDPSNIPTLGKFDDSELDVLLYEFKADLAKYFAWAGPLTPMHSLKDVIAFNETHKDQEMPFFGQELMAQAEKKGPLTTAAYRAALARNHRLSRALGIDAVMTKYHLDALVAPMPSSHLAALLSHPERVPSSTTRSSPWSLPRTHSLNARPSCPKTSSTLRAFTPPYFFRLLAPFVSDSKY